MNIDYDMGWKSHVYGKGGLILSLNQRTHLLRRLRNHISGTKLQKIVDSLWTSKLRNYLQLWTTVRLEETQPNKQAAMDMQKTRNKLPRILERKRIHERKPVKEMQKSGYAIGKPNGSQIKMIEMWKARNYPI